MSEKIMRKLEKMVGDPETVMFLGTFREEDSTALLFISESTVAKFGG
jgi:hypothetical protein